MPEVLDAFALVSIHARARAATAVVYLHIVH
jgi:hypothetical protein